MRFLRFDVPDRIERFLRRAQLYRRYDAADADKRVALYR